MARKDRDRGYDIQENPSDDLEEAIWGGGSTQYFQPQSKGRGMGTGRQFHRYGHLADWRKGYYADTPGSTRADDESFQHGRHYHRPQSAQGQEKEHSHYGRGPRNYQRSAESIIEDVYECLSEQDEINASDITVDVQNGQVILRGKVNNRWERRKAEDLIEDISGVKDIRNELKVSGDQDWREREHPVVH